MLIWQCFLSLSLCLSLYICAHIYTFKCMSPRLNICDICSDILPFFYFETNTTNLYGRPLMSSRYLWSFRWKFTHTLQDKGNHFSCPQHKLVSNKSLQAITESYAKDLNRSAYIHQSSTKSANFSILPVYEMKTNKKWDWGNETEMSSVQSGDARDADFVVFLLLLLWWWWWLWLSFSLFYICDLMSEYCNSITLFKINYRVTVS